MTAKNRRQFRAADLGTPEKAATGINDALLDVYRRLEAEEDELSGVQTTINNLTPTALALAAVGSSPNANGASVSYSDPTYTLTLQPANGTHPGVISGANQTLSSGSVVLTMAETHFTNTVKLANTEAIQFNNSSTEAIRYAGNVTTGLQFIGDNFEYQPNTTSGQMYYPGAVNAERFGIITKDDQSGSPGNVTTTAHAGRAAFTATGAATDTAITITNNTAGRAFAVGDDVYVQLLDLDTTLTHVKAVLTANTITVTGNAAATATCKFAWFVVRLRT